MGNPNFKCTYTDTRSYCENFQVHTPIPDNSRAMKEILYTYFGMNDAQAKQVTNKWEYDRFRHFYCRKIKALHVFRIGDTVEALYDDGKWYKGIIFAAYDTKDPEKRPWKVRRPAIKVHGKYHRYTVRWYPSRN